MLHKFCSIQIFIKNFCKIILIDNIFCQPYRIHRLTASWIYTSSDKRKKDSYLVAAKLWLDLATLQRPDERGCCRMCVRTRPGWKVTPTTLLAPSAQLTMHQKGIFRCFFIRCWGPTFWNGRLSKLLYCCCTNVFTVLYVRHKKDYIWLMKHKLVHPCQPPSEWAISSLEEKMSLTLVFDVFSVKTALGVC
jgi:hypothetical protein